MCWFVLLCCFVLFVVESDVLLCAVCCRVGCVALCDVVLLCDVMESDVLVL